MINRLSILPAGFLLCALPALAFAQAGAAKTYSGPNFTMNERMMIVRTIETGSASGELNGDLANVMRNALKSPNAVIQGDFKSVKDFSDPNCKRISVRMTAPGHYLMTKTGAKLPAEFTFGFNMCKDGTPPRESVEEAIAKGRYKGKNPLASESPTTAPAK